MTRSSRYHRAWTMSIVLGIVASACGADPVTTPDVASLDDDAQSRSVLGRTAPMAESPTLTA